MSDSNINHPTPKREIEKLGLDPKHFWDKTELATSTARRCDIRTAIKWLLEANSEAEYLSAQILRMPETTPFHQRDEALHELALGIDSTTDLLLEALTDRCDCKVESRRRT